MADPAAHGHPDHYSRRYTGPDDGGGVHINSGIPNHAFYITATTLGGKAWEAAGDIWYDALLDPRVTPKATFASTVSTP